MSRIRIYVQSLLIPLTLGAVVGFVTMGSMDYDTLVKPPLSPPPILFPIAWSILYALMGLGYALIWDKTGEQREVNLIYYVQLGVNLLWPFAFFVLKWRLFAFIWLLLLDVLAAVMLAKFYKKYKLAGYLQIPYMAWVLFASYLNLGVYLLNK